jgi:hypothetical protein
MELYLYSPLYGLLARTMTALLFSKLKCCVLYDQQSISSTHLRETVWDIPVLLCAGLPDRSRQRTVLFFLCLQGNGDLITFPYNALHR